nr:immunoglobulin heavy chain junction region [Macaca mulatta]
CTGDRGLDGFDYW